MRFPDRGKRAVHVLDRVGCRERAAKRARKIQSHHGERLVESLTQDLWGAVLAVGLERRSELHPFLLAVATIARNFELWKDEAMIRRLHRSRKLRRHRKDSAASRGTTGTRIFPLFALRKTDVAVDRKEGRVTNSLRRPDLREIHQAMAFPLSVDMTWT
jgi:hypothetical protein